MNLTTNRTLQTIFSSLLFLFIVCSGNCQQIIDKNDLKKNSISNEELVEKFYTAFSNGDAEEMTNYYHEDVTFKDPAFGELKGERAKKMWEMLLSKGTDSIKISFEKVQAADDDTGSASWTARYFFGDKKRKVINKVTANFKFKDGKIIEHIDTFNMWKWSRQALGTPGFLLGWTPFMRKKIQKTANEQLDNFIAENK